MIGSFPVMEDGERSGAVLTMTAAKPLGCRLAVQLGMELEYGGVFCKEAWGLVPNSHGQGMGAAIASMGLFWRSTQRRDGQGLAVQHIHCSHVP
jgi:hypothetical protein